MADQRQRRMAEVLDGAAFAQELGVDRHAEALAVFLARVRSSVGITRLVRRARAAPCCGRRRRDSVGLSRSASPICSHTRVEIGRDRGCRSGGSACRRRRARRRCRATASAVLVVARSRPAATLARDQLVEPGLDDRALPGVEQSRPSSALTSTPTTSWPSAANDAAETDRRIPAKYRDIHERVTRVIEVTGTGERVVRRRAVACRRAPVRDGQPPPTSRSGSVTSARASRSIACRAVGRAAASTTARANAAGSSASSRCRPCSAGRPSAPIAGRDDGPARRHRLENLEPRAAADAQRHDVHGRAARYGRTSSTRPVTSTPGPRRAR